MKVSLPRTVVLANGAFPSHEAPLAALRAADRIVCCDGAVSGLAQVGLEPTWIVGDLDSVSESDCERYSDRLVRVQDQETNDLSKAFRFCLEHGWRELLILGATGLREDHTLSNLSLLADFAAEATVLLLSDTGWVTPLIRSSRLPSYPGQQVSIISLDPQTRITSDGLRYPLTALCLKRWWQASLNEACGDSFGLNFNGGPLLVYQTY